MKVKVFLSFCSATFHPCIAPCLATPAIQQLPPLYSVIQDFKLLTNSQRKSEFDVGVKFDVESREEDLVCPVSLGEDIRGS